eukprot:gnl/MRDRNA2_/MRDRNA2_88971_c0_seq1.p1 gnl/MRDRNA2_/MRDRNA2_88971_c0~~gnl/MRDRNA2_/MRDRNA2_88971_c0_seq1.p1  ORF type:complete len:806 (+),score=190.96 gnl/MRDRNA2_/MRDRNA2_88971_c0_seq1:54-2420(+)
MAPVDLIPSVSPGHATRPTSAPVARGGGSYRPRPETIKEDRESRQLALDTEWRSTERERAELRLLVENDDRFGYAMDYARKSLEKSAGITQIAFAPLADLVWRVLCILWDVEADRFVPKARLRTIIERLREELKGERKALEESRRSYFKELVSLRERCRSLDSTLVSQIDQVVYEDEPVMYYEPLEYLDQNTREHVAEIVEEKLKLILTKQALGIERAQESMTADLSELDFLKDKLRSSEDRVEALERELKVTQSDFSELQSNLMTIVKQAQEQQQSFAEEKNSAIKRAEQERAALKAQMEEDRRRAEEQQQQAAEARRRTTLLESQISQLQKDAETSAVAKQKLETIQQERVEEEKQAAKLEKASIEAQKDAAVKEKVLTPSGKRWSMLQKHTLKNVQPKSPSKLGWKSVLGLISGINEHTKDVKDRVVEREHEIKILRREIAFLLNELSGITNLSETDKANLVRVSDRRIMAWMAGEELSSTDLQPEGWARIRASVLQLLSRATSKDSTEEAEDDDSNDDNRRQSQDHPSFHTECNAEIARLKSEVDQLKATIDRLMVELAAATGSQNMDALRAKLGDERLEWVFQRPSGNVWKRLYDDAAARERRNRLLRERFAEMQQEKVIQDTLGKHCVPESVCALFDGTSTTVLDENVSVFGFTTQLDSSGSSMKRPQNASPQMHNPGNRSLQRPASAVLPKTVSQDMRADGVRPADLYRLATWDPRPVGQAPPPPRRPSSATARRLAAAREADNKFSDNSARRRPSSATRKSGGSQVGALSGARSLPGLHL